MIIMKKILLLTLIFAAAITTNIYAQGPAAVAAPASANAADDAAMLKEAKEKQVPLMVEKTGLSAELANKIVEINFEIRQSARALADLNEPDRKVKITELKALKEKRYSEILTAEQITAVKSFYEEMGKNMQKKAG